MADDITERVGANAKKRIEELERVAKAIIQAIKEIEDDAGEAYMPEGEYFGIKFES